MPGLDGGSALRRPAIPPLVEAGALALTRRAEPAVLACTAPTYPQEPLRAGRHPLLARERARQREALLQATEREWAALVQATTRTTRQRTGQAAMAWRGAQVRQRCKRGKHCQIALTDTQRR